MNAARRLRAGKDAGAAAGGRRTSGLGALSIERGTRSRGDDLMAKKRKRGSCWDIDPDKVAAAESILRHSRGLLRDPSRSMRLLAAGESIKLPLRSDIGVMVSLLEAVHRGDFDACPVKPDMDILRRLLLFCRNDTDLLTHQEAPRYATALLALAAHHRDWVRPLEQWRATSHNACRQFRGLVRHLIARYEVPPFLDAAWLQGLTPEGVKHQGWYKHIALGRNISTADGLPLPLTKKQAHHFLRPAKEDLAILGRWQNEGGPRLSRWLTT
jgi:hypothetical protein